MWWVSFALALLFKSARSFSSVSSGGVVSGFRSFGDAFKGAGNNNLLAAPTTGRGLGYGGLAGTVPLPSGASWEISIRVQGQFQRLGGSFADGGLGVWITREQFPATEGFLGLLLGGPSRWNGFLVAISNATAKGAAVESSAHFIWNSGTPRSLAQLQEIAFASSSFTSVGSVDYELVVSYCDKKLQVREQKPNGQSSVLLSRDDVVFPSSNYLSITATGARGDSISIVGVSVQSPAVASAATPAVSDSTGQDVLKTVLSQLSLLVSEVAALKGKVQTLIEHQSTVRNDTKAQLENVRSDLQRAAKETSKNIESMKTNAMSIEEHLKATIQARQSEHQHQPVKAASGSGGGWLMFFVIGSNILVIFFVVYWKKDSSATHYQKLV